MAQVEKRLSFSDASLHYPEFLHLDEVVFKEPTLQRLTRAVQQLGEGNHNRFIKLQEVAAEQADGNRESDLERLRKLFSSVKNTFIHYDVKNSFLEGLSQGFPDGSEHDRFASSEESVALQAEQLKAQKHTNKKLEEDIQHLVHSIGQTYTTFQEHTNTILAELRELECEGAAASSSQHCADIHSEPSLLQVECATQLQLEADQARQMEAEIAGLEAQALELNTALASQNEELRGLQAQVLRQESLQGRDSYEPALQQSAWCNEFSKLLTSLSGVSVLPDGTVSKDSFRIKLLQKSTESVLHLSKRGAAWDVKLTPKEACISKIADALCEEGTLTFAVREVQELLATRPY